MGRTMQCAVVLAALIGSTGCGRRTEVAEVPLVVRCQPAEPVNRSAADALSPSTSGGGQTYLGLVRGERETDLGFRVGGIVERIGRSQGPGDWHEGDTVVREELLAALQPTDLLANSNQARAKFDFEATRYTNNSKLYAEKAISSQEWESIQSAYRSATADYERAVQSLLDSEIRAPFDGTIIARLASRGETVMPGRTVLRVADLKTVSVELGVPDRVVTRIRTGDSIRIWVRALEGTLTGPVRTGLVSEVGAAAREGSRLFKIVVKVHNDDGSLKPGMTGSVEFRETRELPAQAVLVPISALVAASNPPRERPNQLAVFVIGPDHRAHERPVQTDDLIRSSIIVTEGLSHGERVVVVGAGMLYEGALVDARPVEEPAAP